MRTELKLWRWFGQWPPQLAAQPTWEHCSALIGAFLSLFLWRSMDWPSLSVSLSLFHLTESCGVFSFPCTMSQPLLSFGPLIFTKSLGEFSLSWLARVLHLFSLPLSDLSVGEWQQDSSSGNTSRVLSYTIALNNPLGPKTAPVVETQVSPWQTLAFFSFVI